MRVQLKSPPVASSGQSGILLLHGLCGSPAEMAYLARRLMRDGYDVLCPQLAGHGGEESELTATSWQDWYAGAEASLLELTQRCDRIFVAGLSTGAVLALLLAARHPDKVAGLVLYSPTLWLNGGQVPWYAGLFRLVQSRRLAGFFRFSAPDDFGIKDERLRSFIKNAGRRQGLPPFATPGIAALERQRLVAQTLQVIGKNTAPVLILHPRDDGYAALSNAEYLQKNLATPTELLVLDDSYHLVTVDRQRDLVAERTTLFVARLSQPASIRRHASA